MPSSNGSTRINALLKKAAMAFNNALASPEIMSRLTEFGYDQARLQRCQERVERLSQTYDAQQSLHADKVAATAAYQKARRKADRQHKDLVKRARILADVTPGISQALHLRQGRGSQSFSNWQARQNRFYTELENNTELAAQLLDYGITADKLVTGRAAFEATLQAYNARADLYGLANQATEDRNAAEAEVRDCLSLFVTTARRALADNLDWLKRLGLA